MALIKGKHIVKEIEGELCTVVESGISKDRMNFLKELLEFNKFVVKTYEEKNEETSEVSYTIGVTDLVFNPMISVYEKSLIRPDGKKVSPSYWEQQTEVEHLPYFEYRKKSGIAVNDDDFLPNPWAYRTIG